MPQRLVRNRKFFLLQFLEQEGHIPGLHDHARELAQLGQFGSGGRPRMRGEVAKEFDDLLGRLRHLGGKRIVRIAVETDEPGGFVA